MSTIVHNIENLPLKKIKKQWLIWVILVIAIWLGIFLYFSLALNFIEGILWGSCSLAIIIWQNIRLFKLLPSNRRNEHFPLLPSIGIANWISLSRGILIAFLTGFIFMAKPSNWIGWIPAFLYLAAALLDYVDGIAARLTKTTTLLGEMLDMEMDGLGVLIATIVAIQYGQAPLIYLAVGLARYIFMIGIYVRKKRNLITKSLPASPFRRALAGAQMGFLVAILFPVFQPPATHIAAIFFMTPFLLAFILDFLAVSNINFPSIKGLSWIQKTPLISRAILLLWISVYLLTGAKFIFIDNFFLIILIIFSIIGVASRITSLAIMLMCGFLLRQQPDNIWGLSLFLLSLVLFFTGSGKYSFWKPEDFLLYRRLGE